MSGSYLFLNLQFLTGGILSRVIRFVYLVQKSDKFSKSQCTSNNIHRAEMLPVLYPLVVGAWCILRIVHTVGVLGRYLSNPSFEQWKAAKKVLWYQLMNNFKYKSPDLAYPSKHMIREGKKICYLDLELNICRTSDLEPLSKTLFNLRLYLSIIYYE